MSKILIIDGNNMLHAAYHKLSGMSTRSGVKTNGIFGMPRIFASMIKQFDIDIKDTYLCWDGHKSKGRLAALPNYKDRDKKRLTFDAEDFYIQRDTVMKMIDLLGVKQPYDKEMEADDLMYVIWRKFRAEDKLIISNDKDFHQLLNKRTSIWSTKDQVLYTPKNLKRRKGYNPNQCVDYLTLLGDKSDNIPGYTGIGELKAKEFLNKFYSIKNFLSNPSNTYSVIKHDKLADLSKLNKYLIDLRTFYKLDIQKDDKKDYPITYYNDAPKYREKKFTDMCHKYAINVFRKDNWLNIFR